MLIYDGSGTCDPCVANHYISKFLSWALWSTIRLPSDSCTIFTPFGSIPTHYYIWCHTLLTDSLLRHVYISVTIICYSVLYRADGIGSLALAWERCSAVLGVECLHETYRTYIRLSELGGELLVYRCSTRGVHSLIPHTVVVLWVHKSSAYEV